MDGSDISLVLNTAVKYGVPVAVRSFAGHSYIAQSSVNSEGILLSLEGLNNFSVSKEGKTYVATIGAGLPQIEIYSRLAMNSPPLGLNGGTCPSVALSGLVSGGGEGMTSTFAGITSDRLLSAKAVVYIDGSYKEVEASEELLYALRGGMGGNYGVVTEWRMDVFEANKVLMYSYKKKLNADTAFRVVRDYSSWMRSSSSSIWGMTKYISGGNIQLVGQCLCPPADSSCKECIRSVSKLEDGPASGFKGGFEIQDFGQAMWSWGGCTEWGGIDAYPRHGLAGISEADLRKAINACLDYDRQDNTKSKKSKSLYIPIESKLDSGFEKISMSLVTDEDACKIGQCYIQQSYVGGAMIEEHPNSAFVHRTPGWHVQITVRWDPAIPDPTMFLAWARKARELLLPMSIRESYQNYPDNELSIGEWSSFYFPRPGVFDGLIDIKSKYNPTGILDLPHTKGLVIPTK
jgi:hypothetical protein